MGLTLHSAFAEDKSLVSRVGPTYPIVRNTLATYFDSSGVRQEAAVNEARFDHDPVTLESLGLLVEEARTNLFQNSEAPVTQNITTAAATYTVWMEGAGSVTLSGTGSGVATDGSPITVVCTAGTLTLTVAGGPNRVQVELGAFKTSYIETAGATVTRNADDVTGTGLTGIDNTQGSIYLKAYSPNTVNNDHFLFLGDTGADGVAFRIIDNFRLRGVIRSTSTEYTAIQPVVNMNDGAAHEVAFGYAANDAQMYIDGTAGTADTSLTVPVAPMDRIYVGARYDNNLHMNGHIAEIRYYDERLTDEQLEDMSNGIFPAEGNNFYIAMSRRTTKQMKVKQRIGKARKTLRSEFQ